MPNLKDHKCSYLCQHGPVLVFRIASLISTDLPAAWTCGSWGEGECWLPLRHGKAMEPEVEGIGGISNSS